MTPDDVRLTARLVVDRRVHVVTDEAVMALARRVLELESDAEEHAANVRHVEREACAKLCKNIWLLRRGLECGTAQECYVAIRARGDG